MSTTSPIACNRASTVRCRGPSWKLFASGTATTRKAGRPPFPAACHPIRIHIGWVTDSSIYDAAGRVTQKIGAALVTVHYDAAGNRLSTNRGDVNVYDGLN